MKLSAKLALSIILAILAVMSVHAWLEVRREVTLYDADLMKTYRFGRALKGSTQAAWERYGADGAMRLIEEANEAVSEVEITWRWVDAEGARRLEALPGGPEMLKKVLGGEIVQFITPDRMRRFTIVPIGIEGQPAAVIRIVESLHREHQFIETTHWRLLITTLFTVLACSAAVLALGWWFIGRPVRELREKARAVGGGDLSASLSVRQRDEIGELARDINAMCARLNDAQRLLAEETEARIAAIEQLRHTDRLTTLGRLASGVAHELGTPLSVISGRAEMIASGEAQGVELTESARVILDQASLMTGLIRQLLNLARRQGPKFGMVSLRAVVAGTVDLLRALAGKHGMTIDLRTPEDPLLLTGDQNQIQQALTNVMINGLHAMRPGGGRLTVTVDTARATRPDEGAAEDEYLRIVVEDEGSGIAPDDMPHIFEPFFTTKSVGEGTGLGLAVAEGIVRDHGGWIDVASESGRGSRFAIYLRRSATRDEAVEVAS